MGYNLKISAQADNDTFNAVDYYDLINPKLGERFITELFETYLKIKDNPKLFSYISSDPADKFRDVKLKSFPFVVIYEFHETDIFITAVLNTHRKPTVP